VGSASTKLRYLTWCIHSKIGLDPLPVIDSNEMLYMMAAAPQIQPSNGEASRAALNTVEPFEDSIYTHSFKLECWKAGVAQSV